MTMSRWLHSTHILGPEPHRCHHQDGGHPASRKMRYNVESVTRPLIGVGTMAEQEKCECQSGAHGHRPGKCPHPGEEDGLCKECNEERRAAEANPYGETRSRRP